MNIIRRHPFISFLVGLGVFVFAVTVAVGAANSSKSLNLVPQSGSSAVSTGTVSATPAATHSAKKVHHTITYSIKGAPAMVTFGVNGAEQGDVPMHVTRTFNPKIDDTYEIVAMQLNAGSTGTTYIKILIDGKVMAHATVTSEHKTATVDISRLFGEWVGNSSTF